MHAWLVAGGPHVCTARGSGGEPRAAPADAHPSRHLAPLALVHALKTMHLFFTKPLDLFHCGSCRGVPHPALCAYVVGAERFSLKEPAERKDWRGHYIPSSVARMSTMI
jgi:hypothetical protein